MLSHFVVRVENMTEAERRMADEQAGVMAKKLWELGAGLARWLRALGS